MGTCFVKRQNLDRTQQGQQNFQPLGSITSLGGEENRNNQCYGTPVKKELSNVTVDSSQAKVASRITLSDGQTSDIYDLPSCLPTSIEDWTEQHNQKSRSVIIKKGDKSKKKQPSIKQNPKMTIQSVSKEEYLQAGCITQRENGQSTKFTISSKEFDIEFTLPRSRAGPLVVPYIDFDRYCLIQSK